MITPIEKITRVLNDSIYANIENAFNGGAPLGAFILTFLAIDCLGGFYNGTDSGEDSFIAFMGNYDSLKEYNAKELYIYCRHGLVHNYTIHKNKYALTHNNENLHNKISSEGCIILNFESFYKDFKKATQAYLDELQTNKELADNLSKRLSKSGILTVKAHIDPFPPQKPLNMFDNKNVFNVKTELPYTFLSGGMSPQEKNNFKKTD